MVFLYRKRITFLLSCFIVSVCFCLFQDNRSISTVSTPVSNHVVVLDAGHGLPDRRS